MRKWLICLRQNARLTAGTVTTLAMAHAVIVPAALQAPRINPTTEPASVSNHRQIRYLVLFLLCWPVGHYDLLLIFHQTLSPSLLFVTELRRSPKAKPCQTFNGNPGLYFFVRN